ncbi:MAG: hypothetical protein HC819_23880 [Cyclobacteriaceae bacterium]|nr:hypothetical protein [Cyclobacteriaceae bacterium]
MKDCEITDIDKERKEVVEYARKIIHSSSKTSKEDAENAKNKIVDFRMKLAYNRGTEALEGNFEWTPVFDDLIKELELIKSSLSS